MSPSLAHSSGSAQAENTALCWAPQLSYLMSHWVCITSYSPAVCNLSPKCYLKPLHCQCQSQDELQMIDRHQKQLLFNIPGLGGCDSFTWLLALEFSAVGSAGWFEGALLQHRGADLSQGPTAFHLMSDFTFLRLLMATSNIRTPHYSKSKHSVKDCFV